MTSDQVEEKVVAVLEMLVNDMANLKATLENRLQFVNGRMDELRAAIQRGKHSMSHKDALAEHVGD